MATNTIEGICNQALDMLGWPRHIGHIYEGTKESRVALDAFSETRDELLALQPWPFALLTVTLAAAGFNPVNPYWAFEYAYPSDAIKVWDVAPATVQNDIEPLRWQEIYDTRLSAPAGGGVPFRAIVTNISPVLGVYTSRVTALGTWSPEFVLGMVQALSEKFKMGLMNGGMDAAGGRSEQRSRSDRPSQ